jgi:hypothetical protein
MYENGSKVTDEFAHLKLNRVLHAPYSPDLNTCDFLPYGMSRQNIRDPVFRTVEETIATFQRVWAELFLDDLQSVFFNSIERYEWISEYEVEGYRKSY